MQKFPVLLLVFNKVDPKVASVTFFIKVDAKVCSVDFYQSKSYIALLPIPLLLTYVYVIVKLTLLAVDVYNKTP